MKSFRFLLPLVFLVALLGCRAHVVKITLTNTSAQPLRTIIVDYPSATFGKDVLAPGATFSYAIKPIETGPLKIHFTNATGAIQTYLYPALHKNDDGSIEVSLNQNGAVAVVKLGSH
jgi:hypothetical protein